MMLKTIAPGYWVRASLMLFFFKHPTRDACLYMEEATPLDSPDPHFLFTIAFGGYPIQNGQLIND